MSKKKATILFPLLLINISIGDIIKQFELYINTVIINTNNIYIYFSLFILFKAGTILIKIYPNFIFVIKTTIIIKDNLDYYKRINIDSHFCKFYYTIVIEKKILKFRFTNYINIQPYLKYSNVFKDLITIKKAIITYTYFIMSMIKLRLKSFSLFTLYY